MAQGLGLRDSERRRQRVRLQKGRVSVEVLGDLNPTPPNPLNDFGLWGLSGNGGPGPRAVSAGRNTTGTIARKRQGLLPFKVRV